MSRKSGFTLIELMVTIALVGILMATAVPVYHTWLQRAYGEEAKAMVNQILSGEILYYLEHNSFYPAGAGDIYIEGDNVSAATQQAILDAIKVFIPAGHPLSYQFNSYEDPDTFTITISADFALFRNGITAIFGHVDSTGKVTILY